MAQPANVPSIVMIGRNTSRGIQGPKTLQSVRIVTDADTYAEHESAEGIVTKFTVGEVVWDKMVNSTKSTDNEKRDNNQTTFHAFVSFPLLYNRYPQPPCA